MKKIGVLLLLVALLTGCAAQKPAQNAEAALEDFDVVLDWYPNGVHAFLYEAIEKGYYEEEGLNVNIRFPANPNDAIALTAAGRADAGVYYLQDAIQAKVNEDVPVQAVGSVLQSAANVVLSLKEKNIQSPKDLVGKTIGYSGTVLSEALVQAMMENVGASAEDITLIDVGFDLMSSMTTGKVDATIGCMLNHEVPQMEEDGFEVNYFFPHEYGTPPVYELIFLAGEDTIQENSEKLQKFLRASEKGFRDMKANPEEALEILLKYQNAENFPLSESVERQSIQILLPLMETEDAAFLSQSADVWQANIDWMFARGLIDRDAEASEFLANINE